MKRGMTQSNKYELVSQHCIDSFSVVATLPLKYDETAKADSTLVHVHTCISYMNLSYIC